MNPALRESCPLRRWLRFPVSFRWNAWFARWRICSGATPTATFACAAQRRCDKSAHAMCSEHRAMGVTRPQTQIQKRETRKLEMNTRTNHGVFTWPNTALKTKTRRAIFPILLCGALFCGQVAAASAIEPAPVEPTKPGEPATQRVSADRNGSLPTNDGLTLRLTTDLGSVKITSLPAGAPPIV